MILRVVAKSYAGFANLMAAFIRAGFLDFATGDWLTLLAFYVYGVQRVPATFATGKVTLRNTGGGIYDFGIGEVTVQNTTTKKTYFNTEVIHLGAGGTASIGFQAYEAGSASSSIAGGIDALVTTMLGVTVANPIAFVGADEQSDDELRAMCRAKLGALSMLGPRGAYAYAVTSAKRDDGSAVNINRFSVSPFSSTGTVTVYCAAPSGAPDPTDLQKVADQIEAVARPDTVTASALGVTTVAATRTLTLYARKQPGVDESALVDAANKALLAFVATYPIGGIPTPPSAQGYLYGETLEAVAQAAHPSIYRVTGGDPDLLLNPGEVAILNVAVSARIVEVP